MMKPFGRLPVFVSMLGLLFLYYSPVTFAFQIRSSNILITPKQQQIKNNIHVISMKSGKSSPFSNMFTPRISTAKISIENINRLVVRCSWASWWVQIILSVISGVILTFANTVRRGGSSFSFWSSGFALSTIGVGVSFINCFWTWNITRLARRVSFKNIDKNKIIPTFRNYFRIAIIISLIGMLTTLLGAEQIVGVLASKVLNAQGFGGAMISTVSPGNTLQALDIFLVQANTNVLVAHFAPLILFLFVQTQIPMNAETQISTEGVEDTVKLTPAPIVTKDETDDSNAVSV